MGESMLLAPCTRCSAVNRIARTRLRDAPVCGRCRHALFEGHPFALGADGFDRHVGADRLPLLVDFWAPWCGPCLQMAPQFEAAARLLEPAVRLAKVDTEAEPALGSRFGIRSIPTLVLFAGGQEIARQAGAVGSAQIVQWVRLHVPPA
ncbi:MAG: thioredoxin TrxC [Lysobacteraceae bacterium]|nr:MAG: thioredoxin TrxC [Xanthomonadaceae bacterium]